MFKYGNDDLLSRGLVSKVRLLNHRPYSLEEGAELTSQGNSVADRAECRALVVDCSNLKLLSSALLSKLILLQRRLTRNKARLVLVGLRAEVREVLSWTKLDRFFEIGKDEEQKAAACA